MTILQWVFQDLGIKGAQDSCVEEHRRYRRPFKGLSLHDWFVAINRMKYGDFVPGRAFEEDN